MPPRVSPSRRAASTSSAMRAAVAGSAQRAGSASIASRSAGRGQGRPRRDGDRPDLHHVADDARAEHVVQERLGDRPESDPRGGLPRRGALEDRAGLVEAVLLHPGEVGVPGARAGQRGVAGLRGQDVGVDRVRRHDLDPLRPLAVADLDGHRAAHRAPMSDAADHADLVGLELHPGATTDAEAPALELTGDVGGRDRDIGRHALEHADKGLAVRLAGGQPSKHCPILSRSPNGRRTRDLRDAFLRARRTDVRGSGQCRAHIGHMWPFRASAAVSPPRMGVVQPIETESPSQTTAFWSP